MTVRDRREAGAVAVELAILLPVLGLLLVGAFEVGLWAREHQVLQNAAREGARFSALKDNEIGAQGDAAQTRIENLIITYLANERVAVTASDISIDQNVPIPVGAMTVFGSQIDIAYSRPVFFGLLGAFGADSVTLNGTALFRNFY